jgi:hypothetical protein
LAVHGPRPFGRPQRSFAAHTFEAHCAGTAQLLAGAPPQVELSGLHSPDWQSAWAIVGSHWPACSASFGIAAPSGRRGRQPASLQKAPSPAQSASLLQAAAGAHVPSPAQTPDWQLGSAPGLQPVAPASAPHRPFAPQVPLAHCWSALQDAPLLELQRAG